MLENWPNKRTKWTTVSSLLSTILSRGQWVHGNKISVERYPHVGSSIMDALFFIIHSQNSPVVFHVQDFSWFSTKMSRRIAYRVDRPETPLKYPVAEGLSRCYTGRFLTATFSPACCRDKVSLKIVNKSQVTAIKIFLTEQHLLR